MSGKDGSIAMKETAEIPCISHTGSWDNYSIRLDQIYHGLCQNVAQEAEMLRF